MICLATENIDRGLVFFYDYFLRFLYAKIAARLHLNYFEWAAYLIREFNTVLNHKIHYNFSDTDRLYCLDI